MLPPSVSGYLPHVGLLLILTGLVFAVVATTDYPSKSDPTSGDAASAQKFTVLAYSLIFAGGFVLVGPFH